MHEDEGGLQGALKKDGYGHCSHNMQNSEETGWIEMDRCVEIFVGTRMYHLNHYTCAINRGRYSNLFNLLARIRRGSAAVSRTTTHSTARPAWKIAYIMVFGEELMDIGTSHRNPPMGNSTFANERGFGNRSQFISPQREMSQKYLRLHWSKPYPRGKSLYSWIPKCWRAFPIQYGRAPCGVLVSAFLSVFHFPGP